MSTVQFFDKNERPLSVKPSQVKMHFSEKGVRELAALLTHYPDKKSAILPALWIAQRDYGHLSPEALAEVAVRLERPYVEIEGVATFYSMYHTHKVGRHLLEICTCLTCAVVGAYRLLDYLYDKLGIRPGETTEDGTFTLEEVECLNWCEAAPVVQIGAVYEGNLTPQKIDALLDKLRTSSESSFTKLADTIIQCQLHTKEEVR